MTFDQREKRDTTIRHIERNLLDGNYLDAYSTKLEGLDLGDAVELVDTLRAYTRARERFISRLDQLRSA